MMNVLELQILQVKLEKAIASGVLFNKQVALDYYLSHIGPLITAHDSRFRGEAIAHGASVTFERFSVYSLTENVVDMHMSVAQRLVAEELNERIYEVSYYSRAEHILFASPQNFTPRQILYQRSDGQKLYVEDLLKVSKYAIAVAEILEPDDLNIELASTSITVFQGIEASLNNQKPISVGKRLHLANGFLATVVKNCVKDTDTKRGITITSTLIDLVIDFFCGR